MNRKGFAPIVVIIIIVVILVAGGGALYITKLSKPPNSGNIVTVKGEILKSVVDGILEMKSENGRVFSIPTLSPESSEPCRKFQGFEELPIVGTNVEVRGRVTGNTIDVCFSDGSYIKLISSTQNQTSPKIGTQISNLSQQYNVDNFYIIIGGELKRDKNGYSLAESLLPSLNDLPLREADGGQLGSEIRNTASLYKVEVVYSDGKKLVYNTSISLPPPPGDDVMRSLRDKELQVGESGYLGFVTIKISPKLQVINFYVGNTLIKSLNKTESSPRIIEFTKKAGSEIVNSKVEKGYIVHWDIENKNKSTTGFLLQYQSASDKWETFTFSGLMGSGIFISPEKITTTMEQPDFRLLITDGFHLNVWYEKKFIDIPQQKNLELSLSSYHNEYWIPGQNTGIELSFWDPETGQGCGALGCKNDSYTVMWSSDKQNICSSDISDRELEYRFKKLGLHTIKVVVQNKLKPGIRGEKTIQFLVKEPDYSVPGMAPYQDKNPNCSAY